MTFYKTSSFGNDFIEIDESDLPSPQTDRCLLAREICDSHRAVGADGVVYYSQGRQAGVPLGGRPRHDGFGFQVHNRDGGRAELSGNGMAGLAAVLFQRRLASSPVTLRGAVGERRVELLARRGPLFELNVEIGRPDFAAREFFPFLDGRSGGYAVDGLEFYPVSVGNPHAVVFCHESTGARALAALGKRVESHPMFPRRVNVEFVQALAGDTGSVFFYERGVGPTLASSTGSAAVFAVLRRLGKVRDRLALRCGAETIAVSWQRGIFIRNFTRLVCRGEYFN